MTTTSAPRLQTLQPGQSVKPLPARLTSMDACRGFVMREKVRWLAIAGLIGLASGSVLGWLGI